MPVINSLKLFIKYKYNRKIIKKLYLRSILFDNRIVTGILFNWMTDLANVKKAIKVLVVEDDAALQEMYKDKLTHEGFDVVIAENGRVGLEKAEKYNPDIVLLDLMMPEMDGKVMLKKLRQIDRFKELPVIIVTNYGDAESIRQTQRYENANEFLIKSNIAIDEIITKIKTLVPS